MSELPNVNQWKDRAFKYACDNVECYNKDRAKNADMCEQSLSD